jgi:hypothetical protein
MSHTNASMVQAFTKVISILKSGSYHPALTVIKNKCSAAVKKYIWSKSINIQLVPPHNHRVNAANLTIATFKEHFIPTLATVDMLCPLQLWDKFPLASRTHLKHAAFLPTESQEVSQPGSLW